MKTSRQIAVSLIKHNECTRSIGQQERYDPKYLLGNVQEFTKFRIGKSCIVVSKTEITTGMVEQFLFENIDTFPDQSLFKLANTSWPGGKMSWEAQKMPQLNFKTTVEQWSFLKLTQPDMLHLWYVCIKMVWSDACNLFYLSFWLHLLHFFYLKCSWTWNNNPRYQVCYYDYFPFSMNWDLWSVIQGICDPSNLWSKQSEIWAI